MDNASVSNRHADNQDLKIGVSAFVDLKVSGWRSTFLRYNIFMQTKVLIVETHVRFVKGASKAVFSAIGNSPA